MEMLANSKFYGHKKTLTISPSPTNHFRCHYFHFARRRCSNEACSHVQTLKPKPPRLRSRLPRSNEAAVGNVGCYGSPSGTAANDHFASTSTLRPASRIISSNAASRLHHRCLRDGTGGMFPSWFVLWPRRRCVLCSKVSVGKMKECMVIVEGMDLFGSK